MSNFNRSSLILVRCSNHRCGEAIPTDLFPVVGKKRLSVCRPCHEASYKYGLSYTEKRRELQFSEKMRAIQDDFSHCRDIK